MNTIKIAILGLGGVGGFYGGKLAYKYEKDEQIKIYFIARGAHLDAIKEKGLHVVTDYENFYAKPALATDSAEEIGVCDYVIIATKSYDLKSSIDNIRACIGKNTVILPLLNGGNIAEKIRFIVPQNTVWEGLSYIVSRKTAPGEIQTYGVFHKMVFGCDGEELERLTFFEALAKKADIDIHLSTNIRESVWRKFYFISVSASLTSYFNITFNDLVNTETNKLFTAKFAEEFLMVAEHEGIQLGENALQDVLKRSEALPPGSTASMHSDFLQGGDTEVETLTGEVVRLAHKHQLQVPLYEKVYNELKSRK
ncbi:MAG: 2-dehydropantoate 2-reductase [Paludibacteraceae bacterium]